MSSKNSNKSPLNPYPKSWFHYPKTQAWGTTHHFGQVKCTSKTNLKHQIWGRSSLCSARSWQKVRSRFSQLRRCRRLEICLKSQKHPYHLNSVQPPRLIKAHRNHTSRGPAQKTWFNHLTPLSVHESHMRSELWQKVYPRNWWREIHLGWIRVQKDMYSRVSSLECFRWLIPSKPSYSSQSGAISHLRARSNFWRTKTDQNHSSHNQSSSSQVRAAVRKTKP